MDLRFKGDDINAKILLVEDDAGDRLLISEHIEKTWNKAAITKTVNLRSAYKICREQTFDLILLDLNLPDSIGPKSVREVRQFTKAPVAVLTGIVTPITEEEALKYGAACVISKSQILDGSFLEPLYKHLKTA